MAQTKHKYTGEDLTYAEGEFMKIYRSLCKKFDGDYDFRGEFIKLYTLCELNKKIYELNDFRASCFAYMYTVPQAEWLLNNITKSSRITRKMRSRYENTDVVNKFILGEEEFCYIYERNGSRRKTNNLEYLYTEIYLRQMAIAARYFIKYNIQYLEKEKAEKDYPSRARILEAAIWWANQMLLGRFGLRMPDEVAPYNFVPTVLIFNTFPSSGKTYLCNTINEMFCELAMIIMESGGVLRVGNEEGNINRISIQTMRLIENRLIFDVYPENIEMIQRNTQKYTPFEKSSAEEWGLRGCSYEPSTCIFKTRDSAINSVRCRIGMFDDPSRGQAESNNVQIQKKITDLYNGDFQDRFKSQMDKCIFLTGTMYNPYDVFSTETQAVYDGGVFDDKRFLNTVISNDKQTVVISNDCEDEYGMSAFPEFIDTATLLKKKRSMTEYDYQCMWRQKPIPAEGLLFTENQLQFYDKIEAGQLEEYAFAYIDPTRRKASDYFSMPIMRQGIEDGLFYYVDTIYKQKSSVDLIGEIAEKIISNGIIKLAYEENIDATLGELIKKELDKRGYDLCELIPIYNTKNKMSRILDTADIIKRKIVFPSSSVWGIKSPIGYSMRNLMEFNGEKSAHDDFPDSLAGFVTTFITKIERKNTIKTYERIPL